MSDIKTNVPVRSIFSEDMGGVPSGMNNEEANAFFSKGELPVWAKAPEASNDTTLVRGVDYDSDSGSMRLSPKARNVLGLDR